MLTRQPPGLVTYLAVSFAAAYAIDYAAALPLLERGESLPLLVTLLARMAAPSLGVAAAAWLEGRSFREAARLRGEARAGVALASSASVVAGYTLAAGLLLASGVAEPCRLLLEGLGSPLLVAVLAVVVVLGAAAGATVNALAALLEEVGWRGYMYGELRSRGLGVLGAGLVVGVAWGLWHAPLVANGLNYVLPLPADCRGEPAEGLTAVAIFTLYTAVLGVLLAAMVEEYGSLYAAAAGHGTVNGVAGFYALLAVAPRLIAPPAGVSVALGLAVVAAVHLARVRRGWAGSGLWLS